MQDNDNPNGHTTAWIYERVSSEAQKEGHGGRSRLAESRSYCGRMGYEVLGETDEAISSTLDNRPGFDAMIEQIIRHSVDVVVAWSSERLIGRGDAHIQSNIAHQILNQGARIEWSEDGKVFDPNDIVEVVNQWRAREENRIRVGHIQKANRARVKAGSPLILGGRVPLGFDYDNTPRNGKLTINEEEAALVRNIYRWLVEDHMSSYAIAHRLYERGILTPADRNPMFYKQGPRGVWRSTTVRKIITNPLYKGEFYFGKTKRVKRPDNERKSDGTRYKTTHKIVPVPQEKWIMAEVPAIIDEATWEAAQQRLAENKQNSPRNTQHEYLLRGMAYCSCGRRLSPRWKDSTNRGYYRCTSDGSERWISECEVDYSLRQDVLEPSVWSTVVDYLRNPEHFLLDVERRREEQADEIAQAQRRAKAAEATIASADRKLAQLLDVQLEGYPKEIIDQKRKELLAERTQAIREHERLTRLQREVEITPDTEAMLHEIADTFEQVLPVMTFEDKRRWLKMLRLHVELIDQQHVRLSGLLSEQVVDITSGSNTDKRPTDLAFSRTLDLAVG